MRAIVDQELYPQICPLHCVILDYPFTPPECCILVRRLTVTTGSAVVGTGNVLKISTGRLWNKVTAVGLLQLPVVSIFPWNSIDPSPMLGAWSPCYWLQLVRPRPWFRFSTGVLGTEQFNWFLYAQYLAKTDHVSSSLLFILETTQASHWSLS